MFQLRLFAIVVLLVQSLSQANAFTAPGGQQPLQQNLDFHLRPATATDLDDITTVLLDAFTPGAAWQYGVNRTTNLDYVRRCMREQVTDLFKHMENTTFANVISVPTKERRIGANDHGRNGSVVAVAVWKILEPDEEASHFSQTVTGKGPFSNRMFSSLESAECAKHFETNMTRADDYNRQWIPAEISYIQSENRTQLYLGILATHPDWDGHNFGAANCQWGMDFARREGWPTTLIATPAGWPLYDSLGFESLGNITVKMLDGLGELWFEYMKLEPERLV